MGKVYSLMESSNKCIKINNFYPHPVTNKIDDSFVGLKFIGNEIHFYYPETYRFSLDNPDVRNDIIDLLRTISIAKTTSSQLTNANNQSSGSREFALMSYLWVIRDFLTNGLYVNREKIYKINQNGRIDWKRTMQSQAIVSNGNIIFPDITVTVKNNVDNLLVEIHRFCLKKSIDYIGWLFNLNSSFLQLPKHTESKEKLYIATLKRELDHTFDDDKRLRLKHFLNVVTGLNSSNNNELVYGVDSYHYIFERMIDSIFGSVKNMQDFYPKAKWQLVKNGYAESESTDLRPDTILINGEDVYVLDSKFYRYGFTGNEADLPETTSIQKQITYGDFIRRNVTKIHIKQIFNAFLIPYDKKRDVFRSDDNIQYVGFAKSTWKDGSEKHEIVHTFLIDFKHVVKTWNRYNHVEDVACLIKEIETHSNLPMATSICG